MAFIWGIYRYLYNYASNGILVVGVRDAFSVETHRNQLNLFEGIMLHPVPLG